MENNLSDARLGVIDTIRGVLLDLADIDSVEEAQRVELVDQMGDVANFILEVLGFEVVTFDEETNQIEARISLPPIE
jgi:hypothetical protein